jgi:hypothetical protein
MSVATTVTPNIGFARTKPPPTTSRTPSTARNARYEPRAPRTMNALTIRAMPLITKYTPNNQATTASVAFGQTRMAIPTTTATRPARMMTRLSVLI